jgi:predicted RNA-binding protein with PUA-like domain
MNYWLMKSEGSCYSIDDLKRDKKTPWGGVRNYQARNFMMRDMDVGDMVLFYHSNDKPSGVYGIGKVVSEAHYDETQFDANDEHFDSKATREKPIWHCVDVAFVSKFKIPISLDTIKFDPKLEGMIVRNRGSRLSIQPVLEKHFLHIQEKERTVR